MYKVFLNARKITLAATPAETVDKTGCQIFQAGGLGRLPELVNHFLKSSEKGASFFYHDEGVLWQSFSECFINIPAAGGLARKGDRFLFIFRKGKWDLPKGKVDKGESARQAALREVGEECGISGMEIARQLPSTWHIYQSPYRGSLGQWILKETKWFEMNYAGQQTLKPQAEEGITGIEWLRIEDFGKVLENTYPNLEQIIRFYL